MSKVILFSEIVSNKARKMAERYVEQGNVVYALTEQGTVWKKPGICCLVADRSDEEEIQRAMNGIQEKYLDLLVLSAGEHCSEDGSIMEPHNYEELLHVLDVNVVCVLSVVNAALPLLRKGAGKRIAVLTEAKSSINLHRGEDDYGYQMSLASINMMERILFNALRPEGFTFRNYAVSEASGGMDAALYVERNLCYDQNDGYIHSDENRLVMRDAFMCELPW